MGLWMVTASYARGEINANQMRAWGLSCLLFSIAYVLFAARGTIPLFWSLVVGNLFFATAYGGFGWAIARLCGNRFPVGLVAAGVFLCTAALFVTEVVNGDSSWRILILAAVTIVPWTVSFVQCSREWTKKPAPHIFAMAVAFLAMILVSFSRVGYALYHGRYGYEGLPTGAGYILGSHILVISPVLLTVGFFLLCAEQTQMVIRKLADTDPLTGILNRRSVILLAASRLASAKRRHHGFACVTIDLDDLKTCNDVHGHAAGDAVLKHVTTVVGQLARAEDAFGRLGGDEFVVFMPHADLAGAIRLAERFREAISCQPLTFGNDQLTTTASFGVADLHTSDESPLDLLNRADHALYEAKAAGGNVVKAFDASQLGDRKLEITASAARLMLDEDLV
jgi:diguanylate cyclase (GGDEF)-like protein